MTDMITVPLAHRLPASEALRLGASEHRDYRPGENITLPRAAAEMLAAAAHLRVNPHDREAVARLLQGAPVAGPPAPAASPVPEPQAAAPATAPAVAAPVQPPVVPVPVTPPATLNIGPPPAPVTPAAPAGAEPQAPQS